jgi:hypothetical protein
MKNRGGLDLLLGVCDANDIKSDGFDGVNFSSIDGWDSVMQLFLVLELERIIGKELEVGEGERIINLERLDEILQR